MQETTPSPGRCQPRGVQYIDLPILAFLCSLPSSKQLLLFNASHIFIHDYHHFYYTLPSTKHTLPSTCVTHSPSSQLLLPPLPRCTRSLRLAMVRSRLLLPLHQPATPLSRHRLLQRSHRCLLSRCLLSLCPLPSHRWPALSSHLPSVSFDCTLRYCPVLRTNSMLQSLP